MARLTIVLILAYLTAAAQICLAQKKQWSNDVTGAKPDISNDAKFTVDNFVKGAVMLPSGNQRGRLKFNGSVVIFNDTVAQKVTRYSAEELKGFIAQTDTFYVYTDTSIVVASAKQPSASGKTTIEKKFIKQVLYSNKVSLYQTGTETAGAIVMTPAGLGMPLTLGQGKKVLKTAFYLKRKNEAWYTKVPDNKDEFKNVLSAYLKSDPALVKQIEQGALAYNDIYEIVKKYDH